MTIPAEELAARAVPWAEGEAGVRAALVYGSLVHGTAGPYSDLDLIIVAEPGWREALWERRAQISELLHGRPAAWSQEPSWQRPYRYQSWDENLIELDLTLDEERAAPWAALALGFRALVDKGGVVERLTADLASWQATEFDAPALDGGTWMWLDYLRGRLEHGEAWMVRYGAMDTLSNRVVPLLGAASHSAHRDLGPADLAHIQRAAPVSAEPGELLRSLRATAQVYDDALDRWAERTGRPRPQHPLAAAIRRRLAAGMPGD
jgi:predicted nucleotidyltransferase